MLLPGLGVAEGPDLVAFITFVQVILMDTLVWEPSSWSTDSQTWLLIGIVRELKHNYWWLETLSSFNSISMGCSVGAAIFMSSVSLLKYFFPLVSNIFIIACWSIFMKTNLKSLSGSSNISVILMLASFDGLFPFMLSFFWFLELLLLLSH